MTAAFALALGLAAADPAARAEPPPEDFCAVLEAIVAAEDQPSPFASLATPAGYGNQEWSKLVVPGFEHCTLRWVERGRAVSCWRNLAPRDLTAEKLTRKTSDCLGLTPTPVGEGRRGDVAFEYKAVRIVIEERCTDACHVGRHVSYTIEARRVSVSRSARAVEPRPS